MSFLPPIAALLLFTAQVQAMQRECVDQLRALLQRTGAASDLLATEALAHEHDIESYRRQLLGGVAVTVHRAYRSASGRALFAYLRSVCHRSCGHSIQIEVDEKTTLEGLLSFLSDQLGRSVSESDWSVIQENPFALLVVTPQSDFVLGAPLADWLFQLRQQTSTRVLIISP